MSKMLQAGIAFLLVGGFAQSLWAMEPPTNFCDNNKCSEAQAEVYKRFLERGDDIEGLAREGVYSGGCYWTKPHNSSREHHGAFYWSLVDNELGFVGRFSFFATTNPYADYDAEQAREKWMRSKPLYIPERHEDYAFINMYPEAETIANRIFYWFRADYENPDVLYVTGLWGMSTLAICELRLNELH